MEMISELPNYYWRLEYECYSTDIQWMKGTEKKGKVKAEWKIEAQKEQR